MSIALAWSLALLAAEPKSLPLVGPDELDPWGVPVKTADKLAIRKVLFARQFEALNRLLVGDQTQARDCQRELLAFDAFERVHTASVGQKRRRQSRSYEPSTRSSRRCRGSRRSSAKR